MSKNDSKSHPKWTQEGVKITLGSHLAKKHEKLNFGCYLLYLRHVGPLPKPSKFQQFATKIVTKCIMKASLQKKHQKVTNMSKNDLKMEVVFGACQSAKPSPEASWSLPGLRNDSGALQGAKMSPKAYKIK